MASRLHRSINKYSVMLYLLIHGKINVRISSTYIFTALYKLLITFVLKFEREIGPSHAGLSPLFSLPLWAHVDASIGSLPQQPSQVTVSGSY